MAIDPKSDAAIANVRVKGHSIPPTGQISEFKQDVTNSEGQLSYTWTLSENQKGRFTAKFSGYAEGYVEGYAQSSFEVK